MADAPAPGDRTPSAPRAVGSPDASRAAPGAPPGPAYVPRDPSAFELLRREERELASLRDPLTLGVLDEPRAWPPFRAVGPSRRGFPGEKPVSARGFAYRYASVRGGPWPSGCDGEAPRPIADDGSLCPATAGQGTLLTDEQLARLLALVASPGPPGQLMRCGYDPHHAFVLFDEHRAPFASVGACFTCGEWRSEPVVPGASRAMGMRLNDGLRQLCRELGLGGCGYDLATNERVRNERVDRWSDKEAQGDLGPEPVEPLPERTSGVAPDTFLRATTNAERRRLCAYALRMPGADPSFAAGKRAICGDGSVIHRTGYDACVASFPSCDATVGQAERCLRALVREPCQEAARWDEQCDVRDACLVGIERRAP